MRPTSPATGGLPGLQLLLLLLGLGLQAPRAQPIPTPAVYCKMIEEIQRILNTETAPPQKLDSPEELQILWKTDLLRSNLHVFLNATHFPQDIGPSIKANLKKLEGALLEVELSEMSIHIQDWEDLEKKLSKYLLVLHEFLVNNGKC